MTTPSNNIIPSHGLPSLSTHLEIFEATMTLDLMRISMRSNLPSSPAPNDDWHLFYEQNMRLSSFFTHLWTFCPRFYHFNPIVDNIYRIFGENFMRLPTDYPQYCFFIRVPLNNDNAVKQHFTKSQFTLIISTYMDFLCNHDLV